MEEFILNAVKDVGFPIVACGYLIIRVEKKLEALATSIQALSVSIASQDK